MVGIVNGVKLRHHAKVRANWSNRCWWWFFNFPRRLPPSCVFEIWKFNGWNGQEGPTALPQHIKFHRNRSNRAEIWRFYDFQDGSRRHLGFLKFKTFNGKNGQECPNVCHRANILSKSVKSSPRFGDFSIFPRWLSSAILDWWCVCLDHPNGIWWSLWLCKIWLESI